jgi:hypothetical protein
MSGRDPEHTEYWAFGVTRPNGRAHEEPRVIAGLASRDVCTGADNLPGFAWWQPPGDSPRVWFATSSLLGRSHFFVNRALDFRSWRVFWLRLPLGPLVKHNRTRTAKLYYHAADCPRYTRVKVDDTKGEQSFAEVSAGAAGYLRSFDCPNPARERYHHAAHDFEDFTPSDDIDAPGWGRARCGLFRRRGARGFSRR